MAIGKRVVCCWLRVAGRLRTDAARRIKSPLSALYLIYQLIVKAQKRWRSINAPEMAERVIVGA